jgi:type IV pilus assembly protein PilX
MMPPSNFRPRRQQRGAALIIALVLLVALTLIGLSASNVTMMEERMAGNTRDHSLALQAAEAALAYAKTNWSQGNLYMNTIPNPGDTTSGAAAATGLKGINLGNDNDRAFWDAYNWAGDSIQLPAGSISEVTTRPRFVIERLPNDTCSNPAAPPPTLARHNFRVTARGTGLQDNTVVILQEQSQCCGC